VINQLLNPGSAYGSLGESGGNVKTTTEITGNCLSAAGSSLVTSGVKFQAYVNSPEGQAI